MKTLTINNVVIGQGAPKIIVPVVGTDAAGVLTSIEQAVAAGADCIEWRADFCPEVAEAGTSEAALDVAVSWLDDGLPAVHMAAQELPVLFTIRTASQGLDNFNYEPANRHDSESARRHYWAVAIGLQDVDGLQVSSYLREEANKYIAGTQTLEETGALIRQHHAQGNNAQGNNTQGNDTQGNDTQGNDRSSLEADLVSQRIVELLASKAFALAPGFLVQVHRHLFQDLDQAIYHAGEFKTQRMIKQEEILSGDSVLYADPSTYEMSLAGAFAAEQAKNYQTLDADELTDFCHFISFLWQIHPFYEGNTRTTAVFSELYLNYLGFSVTNDPFEKHARYYWDALVRAMYRNAQANVFPDGTYLVKFYENAIGCGSNTLNREDLLCSSLFENPELLRNIDPSEALHRKS